MDVPVFEMGTGADPVDIAREGLRFAEREGYDSIIVDTAGRLQVDPLRAFMQTLLPYIRVASPQEQLQHRQIAAHTNLGTMHLRNKSSS